MKTTTHKNQGTREQIRNIEQTNTTSTARQAVEATVATHSTPTGGDTSKQEAAEQTVRQSGSDRAEKPDTRLPIDIELRKQNRSMATNLVLTALHQKLPVAYRVAEVVGKWVWVTFKEQPTAEIRQQLAQLGFHWNRDRQAWQHPCGQFRLSSQSDPHEKYSTYFPARIRRTTKAEPAPQEVAAA